MVDRKVVPFDEFYYQLKLTHVFQKHPVKLEQKNFFSRTFFWLKCSNFNTLERLIEAGNFF
jgi:hypothetical protein